MLAGQPAHRSSAARSWAARAASASRTVDETCQLAIVFHVVEDPVELVPEAGVLSSEAEVSSLGSDRTAGRFSAKTLQPFV